MGLNDAEKIGNAADAGIDEVSRLRAARDAALRAARDAVRDTTRLTRLLTILSDPAPLPILLDRALSAISELFAADIVILLDPVGTGTFVPLSAIGLPEDLARRSFSDSEWSQAAEVLRVRAPVLSNPGGVRPEIDSHLRDLGAEVAAWVPVMGSRVARGVLILARCGPTPFSHSDVDLLTAMAYRLGLALEQAERSRQLEQVVRASREIGRHLDESAVGTLAVRLLAELVRADAVALMMTDREGVIRGVAEFQLDPEHLPTCGLVADHVLKSPAGPDAWPLHVSDLDADGSWAFLPRSREGVRALLAVPVLAEAKDRGCLVALRTSALPFSPDTVRIAMLFARQMSAAVENARLYRAARDELVDRARAERELRESEERLRLALAGANLGMWDWNVATGEVACSPRWAEMLGFTPEEMASGAGAWRELIHPEDFPRFMEVFGHHLEGGTPHYEVEHRARAKSGRWVWIMNRGKVTHRDALGRPVRVVGTCLDLTRSKQVEEERLLIERERHRVWRAESLSRMAGGIAHHFNNLLGAVMGNLEIAQDDLGSGDSRVRRCLDEAMGASLRAAEISQLMLSCLGQTTAKMGALDLAGAAREALRLTEMPKNVRLSADLPSPGPIILGNGAHVGQILTNLMANALEAMGEGGGEMTVAVCEDPHKVAREARFFPPDWDPGEKDWACLSISDSGHGIDAATLERIFEPFYSTKFTGRGLGLSVALGLVRAHGGAISVRGRPGLGATFDLHLPLHPVDAVSAKPVKTSPPPAVGGAGLVLVADDESVIRKMAVMQLERLGYEVVEAVDGVEALARFQSRAAEFRFVLLDLTMPRMGGWEALVELRRARSDIPVILMSGYDEAEVMRGIHPETPQAFLHKPYALKDLTAAIEEAAKWRAGNDGPREG